MKQQVKDRGKALLRRWGYELRRVKRGVSPERILAETGRDAPYYVEYSTPWPIFAPWVGHPDFIGLYEGIASLAVGCPERGYVLMSLAQYARYLPGDFAECGVYRGGSALLLCRTLQDTSKRLYLFDSFQGLPALDAKHDRTVDFREGQFSVSAETVRQLLSDFRQRIDLREGWIPDTFRGLESTLYAFAHIDVDLYQSTLDCCSYFYPRLIPGGVLLFDEYGAPSAHGEKDAVDEYFGNKPEHPIALITGQALVLKVPPFDRASRP
jgi:O-methyltransferase